MEVIPFDTTSHTPRLSAIRERVLRPAIGFSRPLDVLKDPDLAQEDKRAILASWASDGCAVIHKPYLRWMPGTDGPVPIGEVLEALAKAEGQPRSPRSPNIPAPMSPSLRTASGAVP